MNRASLVTCMSSSSPSLPSVDEQLLRTLEQAFAQHADGSDAIDVPKLQRALGLRSEYLARRVLRNFDRDCDGVIDRAEFLEGVRHLLFGSDHDKLMFAFRLHDDDDDGFIGQVELLRMIAISLAEDEVQTRASQPPERLTHMLLTMADSNFDGKISFDELETVVRAHPKLLAQMTRSEALWIAPNEDLLARLDAKPARRGAQIARYIDNRRLELMFLTLLLLANGVMFGSAMLSGRGPHAANMLMQFGRACGACLKLDGALILIPVMRRLLTWVRSTRLVRLLAVDEAVGFHRLLGHTLVGLAIVHTLAFSMSYASGHASAPLRRMLLHTQRGATGFGLLLVLIVMWAFALPPIRRSSRFELFYFSHLLYGGWFALALVHAPSFLPWAAVPLVGWAGEQLWRKRGRKHKSVVTTARALRSGVTQLVIERPTGFTHRPGDYVFLSIPTLARHEWHPFTLSSAPENPALSVHVRSLGNWTSALRQLIEQRETSETSPPLAVQLDGPYGAPSAHVFESRYAVLIGAGIGVTPFASVLESLVLRGNRFREQPCALQKAHFFWLNRDQYSFEWFAALLTELETTDHKQMLDVHICMTGGHSGATAAGLEVARAILHAADQRDVVTGLKAMTHMGHPDWETVLSGIAAQHAKERVDVYFCGPRGLARKLRPICARLGMPFREEQF
jgi:predicted ferric reductase/Ca2+-binding EF-hand superfamily protein